MIKEAIEKIASMAAPSFKEIDGKTFAFYNNITEELTPSVDAPYTLHLNSLEALVKHVKAEVLSGYPVPVFVTIPTHESVQCFGKADPDNRFVRTTYCIAKATDVPGWSEEEHLSFEKAMIALRTRFQETNDTVYALRLLSEITTGAKMTLTDNGIATSIVTKKGISLQTNEAIRPIITLKPYRTFQELEQPASQFLIRVAERGISFIEADGGMWKLTARQTIKSYLEEAFSDEIESGSVIVAL